MLACIFVDNASIFTSSQSTTINKETDTSQGSILAKYAKATQAHASLASIPTMDQSTKKRLSQQKVGKKHNSCLHSAATPLSSLLLSHDNTKDLTRMLTAVFCCLSQTTRFVRPTVVCRSPVFHGRTVSRSARCLEQTVSKNQYFGPSSDRSRCRPILSGLTCSSAGSRLLLHRIQHR